MTEVRKTFLVTDAQLWNSLPVNVRSSTSINSFEQNYCNFIKEGYAGLDSFPISELFISSDPFLILHSFYPFLPFFTAFILFNIHKLVLHILGKDHKFTSSKLRSVTLGK